MSGKKGGAPAPPTYVEELEAVYARQVEHVVARLRQTADHIEERRVRSGLRDYKPDFHAHARDIVHDIASLFPNLALDGMLSAAEVAHDAQRSPDL